MLRVILALVLFASTAVADNELLLRYVPSAVISSADGGVAVDPTLVLHFDNQGGTPNYQWQPSDCSTTAAASSSTMWCWQDVVGGLEATLDSGTAVTTLDFSGNLGAGCNASAKYTTGANDLAYEKDQPLTIISVSVEQGTFGLVGNLNNPGPSWQGWKYGGNEANQQTTFQLRNSAGGILAVRSTATHADNSGPEVFAVTYDGSETPAGIETWVAHAREHSTTVTDTLTGTTVSAGDLHFMHSGRAACGNTGAHLLELQIFEGKKTDAELKALMIALEVKYDTFESDPLTVLDNVQYFHEWRPATSDICWTDSPPGTRTTNCVSESDDSRTHDDLSGLGNHFVAAASGWSDWSIVGGSGTEGAYYFGNSRPSIFEAETSPTTFFDQDGSDPFSIFMMVRTRSTLKFDYATKREATDTPGNAGFGLVYPAGGSNRLLFFLDDGAGGVLQKHLNTALIGNDNMMIGMTYDGSKTAAGLKLFFNGTSGATTTDSDDFTGSSSNSEPFQFGGMSDGTPNGGGANDHYFYEWGITSDVITEAEMTELWDDYWSQKWIIPN